MNKKKLFLTLGLLTIAFICQAMEPAQTWKARKASLIDAQKNASKAKNWEKYHNLWAQYHNEHWDHSFKKANATPLDIQFARAVIAEDIEAVKELQAKGANVNIKWFGKTALFHALDKDHINIPLIEVLFDGPYLDINTKDREGKTLLRKLYDCQLRSHEKKPLFTLAKQLIKRSDCNLNAQDNEGRTVFTQAAYDQTSAEEPFIPFILDLADPEIERIQIELQNLYLTKVTFLSNDNFQTYFSLLPKDIFKILLALKLQGKINLDLNIKDNAGSNALDYLRSPSNTTMRTFEWLKHDGPRHEYIQRIERINQQNQ